MSDPDGTVRERYARQYGRQDYGFRLFDRVLSCLIGDASRKRPVMQHPRRVLLMNAGHLGDIILSTALIPVLRDAFADVEIDVLVGSYARHIVEGHPMIGRVHIIDHWRQSRGAGPAWRRAARYWRQLPELVRNLRACNYDLAVDLRSWFPNFVPLAWLAGIPIRVAYDRLGFGPMLTHRLRYLYGRRHEVEYHLDLLRALGIPAKSLALAFPSLRRPAPEAWAEVERLLGGSTRYRILHPASSTPSRDWTIAGWRTLASNLLRDGIVPLVTGAGERDRSMADDICAGAPGTVNAVGRLSWDGLVALVSNAEAVYSVETSVGHLASALRRPVISLYGGMADPRHWAPLNAKVVTHPLPCHPCLDKRGCATRTCITGVTVADVEAAAEAAVAACAEGSAPAA